MTLAGLSFKVLGVSDAMKSHLQKCDHVSDDVKAWARDWTKDSAPYVSDAADSDTISTLSNRSTEVHASQRHCHDKHTARGV